MRRNRNVTICYHVAALSGKMLGTHGTLKQAVRAAEQLGDDVRVVMQTRWHRPSSHATEARCVWFAGAFVPEPHPICCRVCARTLIYPIPDRCARSHGKCARCMKNNS